MESVLSFDEWSAGENKDPKMHTFDPSTVLKNDSATKRQRTFKMKVGKQGEVSGFMEEMKSNQDTFLRSNPEDLEKIEHLEKTVADQ